MPVPCVRCCLLLPIAALQPELEIILLNCCAIFTALLSAVLISIGIFGVIVVPAAQRRAQRIREPFSYQCAREAYITSVVAFWAGLALAIALVALARIWR